MLNIAFYAGKFCASYSFTCAKRILEMIVQVCEHNSTNKCDNCNKFNKNKRKTQFQNEWKTRRKCAEKAILIYKGMSAQKIVSNNNNKVE